MAGVRRSQQSFDHLDLHRLATSSIRANRDFQHDPYICTHRKEDHVIDLLEVDDEATTGLAKYTFRDVSSLASHLNNVTSRPAQPVLRFFFLHQQYTWAPLNASKAMITTLVNHFGLSGGIFHSLSLCRDRTYPTEEAFSGAVRSIYCQKQFELGYVYKYPERREEKGANPWKIRQTGLHHLGKDKTSTFIIISPYPNTRFTDYLKSSLEEDVKTRSMVLADPMVVHNMLLSTHFNSWRGYLEYQETLLIDADMKATCTALNEPLVNFETLKHVRTIERCLQPLEPLLKSFKDLLSVLSSARSHFGRGDRLCDQVIRSSLDEMQRECATFREHAAYLSQRAQSTAQSISDTLTLHQSENACILAQSARDDSVAIKILTLVASCYLPFSFVATMLGMNLVAFDVDTRDLVVSNQFWLYFALSIPLMAVTLLLCRFQMWKHNKDNPACTVAQGKDVYEFEMV